MKSKFVTAMICCALAGSYSARAASGEQEQINLDWKGGAKYFRFPEGAQLKVTELVCPPRVTVSVVCRTATRARCGSWYLALNETATAGSKGDTGVASINYNGPAGSNCRATVVVQSP